MTNTIKSHTFLPHQRLPNGITIPKQTHGSRIVEIVTGTEDLTDCDGVWTRRSSPPEKGDLGGLNSRDKTPPNRPFSGERFLLGVRTADCAPICIWNNERFGIVHAGWRGTINGVIENMLEILKPESGLSPVRTRAWIGPILPRFEIQKDDCYDLIYKKFGDQFFTKIKVDLEIAKDQGNKALKTDNGLPRSTLIFEFKKCLQYLLPDHTVFDDRSTFDTPELASWRRDKAFPKGQNVTVIGVF